MTNVSVCGAHYCGCLSEVITGNLPPYHSTWLSKPGTVGVAVNVALREGYRRIDCAHRYENQAEIGGAIQSCIKEGVVSREDLFVASKLWWV